MKKPYTHDSFGQPHRKPEYYTARENESGTPREIFQNLLRNIDTTTCRRHNEGTSEAVMRVVMDAIAMREVIEAILRGDPGATEKAQALIDGLDAVQELSDEHWAKKQKDAEIAANIPACDCGYSRSDSMIGHHKDCAYEAYGRKHNLERVAYDVRDS